MGMGKITWMLLVPLSPSILLFVIFPEATFSLISAVAPHSSLDLLGGEDAPRVSTTGVVALYFALIETVVLLWFPGWLRR
jgi:hypothetical protein